MAPDCETCWKKTQCPRAQAGAFCMEWQSKKPGQKGEDPNDAWQRGEDAPGTL